MTSAIMNERRERQQPVVIPDRRQGEPKIIPLDFEGPPAEILIVDDHPVNRMLLKQKLELLGVHVHTATDGAKALALWKSGNFDLLITDCHMPEMDGYELTRSVREMEQQIGAKHIPIIAWSANVLSEEADHCRTAGMDDLLNDLADLRAMLVKWLPMTNGPSTGTYPVYVLQVKHDTPLDLRVLNKFGSDRAALIELLEVFKEQNRADIVLLHNILQREDQLAVARAAHRIKGACQMMGARELEALSIRIEQAAKQGDLQDARTAAEMLDEVVVRLEMEIAGFIKR